MNKTDEALAKILSQLSDKFGTTSAHLWQVLLRQAYIDGTECAALCAVLLIILVITAVLFKKNVGKEKEYCEDDFVWYLGCGAIAAICILGLCFAGAAAIDAFLNPEYYALHEILKSK